MPVVVTPEVRPEWQRLLIVAAHPDDETVGAGALLQERLAAHARRAELRDGFARLPRQPKYFVLPFYDHELSARLSELTARLPT